MTSEEFKAALQALGWKQTDFARKTGLNPATISRWVGGDAPVPEWAERYLRAMQRIGDLYAEFVLPDKGRGESVAEE